MITLPLGFLFSLGVLLFALHDVDVEVFLNVHSFVIVCVGTIAVLFMSNSKVSIADLWKGLISLGKKEHSDTEILRSVYKLAQNRQDSITSTHPLVDFAQELWEQGLDDDMFELLLEKRLDEINSKEEGPVAVMRNLAKYPPALGMMGTVMGMVQLFANMTVADKSDIGANLALAMTATFYGLILSNLFFAPLSDRLHNKYVSHSKRNDIVYNALILINRDEPLSIIENCSSYELKERRFYAKSFFRNCKENWNCWNR